ncbi:hypothetical protein HPP92_008676 [Vanilla planifolia]|uniref:D-isomer specific 2-hydroxyacid dehydrogenase NAD-binding domain-containing protein n=1 Tax=Vanilla planifolia TaxID=51239 RepID=A0A835V843_VANPL|nr:hypothetical protein HPP92_008874 [Vanilla planifolia]KAG0486581.1 hypothetical protein HPP92_008676 [Vanilla planifolia]
MLEAFGCIIFLLLEKKAILLVHIPSQCKGSCCPATSSSSAVHSAARLIIVDGDVMEALGKEGIIINVGRGAVVDEREMVRRLKQSKLSGAGLDVFEDEPVVSSGSSPWTMWYCLLMLLFSLMSRLSIRFSS